MSEIKHTVWYPPAFPLQGRLPRRVVEVQHNILRQCELEQRYHDALCVAAGYRVTPPCCKTLHISLFFDGTGNNLNNDLFQSQIAHPTNIARLFRATIGDGLAGGTGHLGLKASGLTDATGTGYGQYFKYYMPGVGTPFAEVGDLDYSTFGLAGGWFGEERINWALLMIIDALRRTLGEPLLDNDTLRAAVKAMGTWKGSDSGRDSRKAQFFRQLNALEKPLRIALTQPQPGISKLLGIKLYVYGFSRGAAAARAFVSWLNELLHAQPFLKVNDLEIPLTVEYLGVLDTVASVGIADIMPGARGHMDWADGNQQLPDSGLVKRCLHLVASHEQRVCFPLESIRRQGGDYPANCVEVIYPGVHSDLGGGYPPGDQGKAAYAHDGLLLSQIALHDLYADAFAHGAPLKTYKKVVPIELQGELWRAMDPEVLWEFEVDVDLINCFNAWREVTLGLLPAPHSTDVRSPGPYQPTAANIHLEHALHIQLGWITAWRIDRYAFTSLNKTNFYRRATDSQADPNERNTAKYIRNKKQAAIEKGRKEQTAAERIGAIPQRPLQPGIPDFDADMARTQLREAAEEFGIEYRSRKGAGTSLSGLVPAYLPPGFVLRIITADVRKEGQQMKSAGQEKVGRLFPPLSGYLTHLDEKNRGKVDEYSNAGLPEGLLRDLFDDHVHDSRAWFLYSLGREPLGSYFRERMVFFGEASRREVAMHGEVDTTRIAGMVMDAQRIAQAQQAIDAQWQAYYAQTKEVTDDLV